MPVILDPQRYDLWLDPGATDISLISEFLKPFDASLMFCFPVSSRVNRPVNDDPEYSAPVGSNDQRQWLLFPRDDNPQRENRMLAVTARCIQPSADGDEPMPHGRASRDTMNSGLRSECLPAIS
jgi:hypothetical protein